MPIRTASAKWNGSLKEGKGEMEYGSGHKSEFSFGSRMEDKSGSNPEELLSAALAGCYSMALSADLGKAGFQPVSVTSQAKTNFDNGSGQWTIETIELTVEANVPNIDDTKFQEIAQGTKTACPVSRALTGVKINVTAKLVSN